jgi:putative flippase GtrA
MGTTLVRLALVWLITQKINYKTNFSKIFSQLFRYGIIGILVNSIGYLLYIFVTFFLDYPKSVMSCLYIIGASLGFILNRSITFCHEGSISKSATRYIFAQFLGFLINYSLLSVFVDHYGIDHQVVQAFSVVVVAIVLFVMLRVLVFSSRIEELTNHKL